MPELSLPSGSNAKNIASLNGAQYISASNINSLANNGISSAMTFSNTTSASTARVIIMLERVVPVGTSTIELVNGTDFYSIGVNATDSAKAIIFNNIPTSFLIGFQIRNKLGVAFHSTGNSILIIPT